MIFFNHFRTFAKRLKIYFFYKDQLHFNYDSIYSPHWQMYFFLQANKTYHYFQDNYHFNAQCTRTPESRCNIFLNRWQNYYVCCYGYYKGTSTTASQLKPSGDVDEIDNNELRTNREGQWRTIYTYRQSSWKWYSININMNYIRKMW